MAEGSGREREDWFVRRVPVPFFGKRRRAGETPESAREGVVSGDPIFPRGTVRPGPRYQNHFTESLILAQNERWRRV